MTDEKADNLAVGNLLGHYRILQKIGTGGMGEVYLAHDTKLERSVALKVLPSDVASNEERMRRFTQEAKAAAALNHPNIAHIYEIGESDGINFIAMEYVEGVSLDEKIAARPLPVSEIIEIGVQIADALDEAHSQGITHRDIKSANVMLTKRGRIKVLDFGLAKISTKIEEAGSEADTRVKTQPGVVMGTVSYMSPEQALGRETDARTDIWSFGVVLYEMATGKLPFQGESLTETIDKITHAQPEAIARFNYDVPPELEVIIKKALRKKPEERYQSAHDIRVDLQSLARELDLTEHSIAPKRSVERKISSGNEQPTQTLTQKQTVGTSEAEPIHTTSSAEYIATEIKQHKRGFVVGLIILLFVAVGFGLWFLANRSANTKQIESIAVLPFVNESGNADNEYLSDGITESLISSLSQIPKLNVKARSSVFRYKGKETDLKKIAGELNVQAILNGRFMQRGEQLILNLELVDARTENVIWSETYTRKQSDLVSLQSEIARDVSNKLRTKLSGAEQNQIAKNYTANTEAYQLYLKGRYYWNKRTEADIKRSIDYFNQAIAFDPTYALAYAGLADAYQVLPSYTDDLPPEETYPKARAAAQKALEIDATLAEPHAALGVVLHEYEWNFAEAEKEFKRAIELNPNYASAHQWYGEYLRSMGRLDEAITEIKRAQQLDPLSLIVSTQVGQTYYVAHRYDDAIAQLHKTIEIDPNFSRAYGNLARAYMAKGMYEEAIEANRKGRLLRGMPPEQVEKRAVALKEAYRKLGARGYWQKALELEQEEARKRNTEISQSELARFQIRMSNKEQALDLLEKSFESGKHDVVLAHIKTDPVWEPLHTDPRFQDLLRRIGFPQ